MIIAHLPAGYLLTKLISGQFEAPAGATRRRKPIDSSSASAWSRLKLPPLVTARKAWLWACALTAALLPDIDIIWFYLDGGGINHRHYPTHWPLFWLALFLAAALTLLLAKRRDLIIYPAVIAANALFHLLLDALAGPIFYAAPFFWAKAQLITVPAVYDEWIWNFFRHWTFQLELMIWAAAGLVYGLSGWEKKTYI